MRKKRKLPSMRQTLHQIMKVHQCILELKCRLTVSGVQQYVNQRRTNKYKMYTLYFYVVLVSCVLVFFKYKIIKKSDKNQKRGNTFLHSCHFIQSIYRPNFSIRIVNFIWLCKGMKLWGKK